MTTAASYSNLVQELYVAYFGRPADYYGLQNFEAALAAANAPTDIVGLEAAYSTNVAVKTLVDSFGTSAESQALYGNGSTASFVNAIFENLFNRAPAVAGLAFWVNAIDSGAVTKGDAALAISAGAVTNTTAQGVIDAQTVTNKLAVASNFTTDLGASAADIVAYSGAGAAATARALVAGVTSSTVTTGYDATVQATITAIVNGHVNTTYTLTTGVDTLVGGPGNNAFNAILDNTAGLAAGGQAATLNAFDSITGGTQVNTLNIHDFGQGGMMSIPTSATISGITVLNVNTLEGVTDDLSGWSTLAAVNIATANGAVNIAVPDAATLSITNTNGNISTSGGSTIALHLDTGHSAYVSGGADTSSVSVTGGAGGNITDLNYGSSKANTITSVSVTNSHNTTTVDSDALTSLSVAGESYGSVTVHAAAGTRTLNLSMDGDSYTTVVDATATTVDVSAINHDSTPIAMAFGSATSLSFNDAVGVAFIDGGTLSAPLAKSLTIAGAGDFTASTNFLNGAAAIDATGSQGVTTIELASASAGALTQTFAGGAGQDIIWIGAGQTGAVTGGSAANNEIVLSNAAGATEADVAAVTHFSTLGVSGSTSGTFDMSKLATVFTAYDVQGSGGDVTFDNVAAGATLSLEGGNAHSVVLSSADGHGATDTASVSLGTTTSGGHSYTEVSFEDSTHLGTATVNLVSNVSSASSANTLTTLHDNNLVTLNLSGTGTISITNVNTVSTTLSISNAVTSEAYIANLTDNSLTTLNLSGSNHTIVNNLNSTSTSLTIVDSDTAAVAINNLADTALTSATFTNTVNSKAATFAIGGSVSGAGLATLNLNGNVQVSIVGDAVTSGITVAGATDNANVSFVQTGLTAAHKANVIALGNGNDAITLGSSSVAPIPGATEVDTVTWKAITGTTETVDVTWQDFATATAGTETIGGMTVTSDGSAAFTAVQIASVVAGATIAGLTATAAVGWDVTAGTGTNDSTFTSQTHDDATALAPSDASSSGSGASPTFTETTAGSGGGSESIGGATVTAAAGATYLASDVATVAAGGTVAGLTLTAPTIWTIGTASGATTTFTSTTANHAEPSPIGAGATGDATAPTSAVTTAGVTPVSGSGGGGAATSSDTLTLGSGNNAVADYTAGSLTITATESSTSADAISANNASTLHLTLGNGTNAISATAAGASISITTGTGLNAIAIGAGTTGSITVGSHAATAADSISLGASGTSVTALETITGLNNVGLDTITFADAASVVAGAVQNITEAQVLAAGGDPTQLASWIAAATGADVAAGAPTMTAHGINWFTFHNTTYLVETAGVDTGALTASDTVVELTGTNYTFAKATATGGVFHLLG